MELVVRTSIGPFEMAAHLDSGGMADVYLAHGADPGRLVVVKVMRPQHRGVREIVDMFCEEARVMRRLVHRNVVQVLDDGVEDGCPWIAMEYLDGDHLGTLIRAAGRMHHPPSPTLAAWVGLEVSRGLAYVHGLTSPEGQAMGLVHRDISPQNIFLCYTGEVKLLDFGIAKAIDRDEATRTGVLKGKIAYLSPEQVRHQPLDGRSDLFSLGIVLWELLAGRRLFRASNEYDTMRRICEQPAPALDELRPDAPKTLVDILGHLLQRAAEDRYQTADALAHALDAFLEDQAATEDELARFAQTVLARRQTQKAELVTTVRREGALQLRLFGDLIDSLDDTGSDELSLVSNRPKTGPDRIRARRMDPEIANAPLVPEEAAAAQEVPAPDQPKPASSRARTRRPGWLLVSLACLALVGAGLLVWIFAFASPAQTPASAVLVSHPTQVPDPADAAPAQTVQPSGVLVTRQALNTRSAKGMASILVDRSVTVSLAGRQIGMAPIERWVLRPGEHLVELRDPDLGLAKRLTIHVQRGQHTTYRVAF